MFAKPFSTKPSKVIHHKRIYGTISNTQTATCMIYPKQSQMGRRRYYKGTCILAQQWLSSLKMG
jgi:hypothetical protein